MDVKKLLLINLAIAFFLILCILSDRWNLIQKPHYTASDFSILEHISSTDCDQDGIDASRRCDYRRGHSRLL